MVGAFPAEVGCKAWFPGDWRRLAACAPGAEGALGQIRSLFLAFKKSRPAALEPRESKKMLILGSTFEVVFATLFLALP